MATEERKKALELAIGQIEKAFGKGSLMRLGDDDASMDVASIPTGSLGLDVALGVGGLPCGRVIEIYGPESSGKTTIALEAIAQAQKRGGVAAFVDAEHALDPSYARKLGVRTNELLISQPDNGEQALEIVDTLVRSGAVDILVVDSVAALVPRAEIEGEMGDAHVGLQARLMSQALRKLTGTISRSKCIETTSGGNALKFYASVRLDIRRIASLKQGDQAIGSRTRVRVVKNKVAPPFREAEFDILYGMGVNSAGELVDLGVELDIVEKSGSWYSYKNERMGQGRDNACEFLREHKDISAEIESRLREALGLVPAGPTLTVVEGGSKDTAASAAAVAEAEADADDKPKARKKAGGAK
jgi:recombination protein RecA